MNRTLIILGVLLTITGLLWPALRRWPLLRLPGDIVIGRPGFTFFFPLTTMLIVSVIVSVIAWLLRRRRARGCRHGSGPDRGWRVRTP